MAIGRSNSWRTICLVTIVSFICMISLSYQSDTILPHQSINSNQTIISRGGIFELGFFSWYGNDNEYFHVEIRYKKASGRFVQDVVVWTANGDTPINSSDINGANLMLTREGDLQLQVNGRVIWNTNTTTTDLNTTKAVLLDNGNLIVGSDSSPNMWESFNYPTDTWLPGAKIGLDASTGKKDPTILTTLYNDSFGMDLSGSSELLIWVYENITTARIGASDFLEMNLASKMDITFNVSKTNGVNYATYRPLNDSTLIRIQLDSSGQLLVYIGDEKSLDWKNVWTRPYVCASDAPCGSNGICSMNQNPVCSCPKGFEPKDTSYLELHDYSGGCVRRNGSQCLHDKDEFVALLYVHMPANYEILSTANCRLACAANCSCSAYSDTSEQGCQLWYGDLLGMEQLNDTTASETLVHLRSASLSYQSDVILPGQSIYYYQNVTSQGGIYELGFYHDRYVGIWYKNDPSTVVWTANRDTPIDSSDIVYANLTLTREGDLQLQCNGRIIWNTNTTTTDLNTTKAVLLDSGNLIVGSDSSPNMWESFNYPTDTWLPSAKIGLDMTTDKADPIILTAGNGVDDSTSKNYSFGIDQDGLLIWNKTDKIWRIEASDFLEMNPKTNLNITFNVSRTIGVNYATYHTLDGSTLIRMVLHSDGQLRLHIWDEGNARWQNVWTRPNVCDNGGTCGSNGICSMNQSPVCSCPKGFHPNYISYLEFHDYIAGCARKHGSQCLKEKDEFIALDNIKWPQNYQSLPIESVNCQIACARNCSCSAYSNTSGCYLWYGDLLDMEQLHDRVAGETMFLRLGPKKGAKKAWRIPLALSITLLILVLGFLSYYVYRKKIIKGVTDTREDLLLFDLEMTNKRHLSQVPKDNDLNGGNRELALPIFSLSSIYSATDNFSSANKLGEGGFGPVYKGKLLNGQEVAVKRLSKHSSQGLDELINEAKLIAKLKHTNLVRLLGCCIQKDEKILIYEYMPNKSLDFFLFDQMKKKMLDWSRRMHIIEGIAQGLLYLHHYSRLRIIHRDLKASNILLDADMKPKISDFGLARIFSGNQLQANTKHIVGTFGYMPPEYALEGLFSIKTDVFSFGVLLLEVLSGQRNTSFHHEDYLNLLGYAWKLWINDTPLELLDPILKTSCNLSTALRYIHVGLLCVQEHPDDRPSISDIIAIIGDEMKVIEVQPTQPAYLARRKALEVQPEKFSLNELTYSTMQPR